MRVRARCPECSHVFTTGKKMRPGGGGSKGAEYERRICTRLSLWVSGFTRQDLFWRSAMSGGRANRKARKEKAGEFREHAGDIVATAKPGNLLIETFCIDGKWFSDFGMESSPFAVQGRIIVEWDEVRATAKKFGKIPLMVAKRNRRGECVFTDAAGRRLLQRGLSPGKKLRATLHLPRSDAWVYLFRDVLAQVEWPRLRAAILGRDYVKKNQKRVRL